MLSELRIQSALSHDTDMLASTCLQVLVTPKSLLSVDMRARLERAQRDAEVAEAER